MIRFLTTAALLTAFVLLVGPWPLPPSPIDETPQGKAALAEAATLGESVREAILREPSSGDPLRRRPGLRASVGLGRREIAAPLGPEAGVLLGGYGIRAGIRPLPSLDVDPGNPCVARALALETPRGLSVVLAADLLYVGVETRRRVLLALARDPGIPMERVMFTATHSHSAPGEFAGGPAEAVAVGRFREQVVAAVVDALTGAARDAAKNLAPAALSVARTSVPAFTRNRYWREGERDPPPPLDADLTVLLVREPLSARLRGVLAVYGAHATCIGPWVPRVSGDWPGALSAALERAHGPGAIALVAAGPVGSQAPDPPEVPHDAAHGGDSEDDRGFHEARAMGEALATEVARLVASAGAGAGAGAGPGPGADADATRGESAPVLETRELPLPPVLFRLAPGWRASPHFVDWVYPTPERAPFSALRIGSDLFLAVPCEVSGEVSLAMKAAAARASPGTRLTVTSFAGHYHGYVPPDACYPRFRYENTLSLHGERHAAFLEEIAAAVASGMPAR